MAATNGFARLARKAGISTTRLHDARHTAATTMLSNGVDPTTAAAILGHSSPTVTLQVYSHVVPGLQQGAIDRLGEHIEALAATECNQIATKPTRVTKKARGYGLKLVAPTGIESGGFRFSNPSELRGSPQFEAITGHRDLRIPAFSA